MIAAVVVGSLWLLRKLWVVSLAVVLALFIARALDAPARWLRARLGRPALVAALGLMIFLAVVAAAGWLVIPAVADEFESLGPTLSEAVDDVEQWLVDDAPFDLDRRELEELRTQVGDAFLSSLRSRSDSLASGALAVFEGVIGLLLAVIATFFFLKDGPRVQEGVLRRLPIGRRELTRKLASRAWETIGGYLRGAAMLGAVESVAIGITLALVGADLVIPVVVLTFAAAFVPMVGAIVAGIVAVLVALSTSGLGAAVVVGIVALVVQQFDNDLLAPLVYGRTLQLHPLVVLFAVVGGGALFGVAGTVLAVPVTAVLVNVTTELQRARHPELAAP